MKSHLTNSGIYFKILLKTKLKKRYNILLTINVQSISMLLINQIVNILNKSLGLLLVNDWLVIR